MVEFVTGLIDRLLSAAVKIGVLLLSVSSIAAIGFATGIIPRSLLGGLAYEWSVAGLFMGIGLVIAGGLLQMPAWISKVRENSELRRKAEVRDVQIVRNLDLLTSEQRVVLLYLLDRDTDRFISLRGNIISALERFGVIDVERYETRYMQHESGAMIISPIIWRDKDGVKLKLRSLLEKQMPNSDFSPVEIERAAKGVLEDDNIQNRRMWRI